MAKGQRSKNKRAIKAVRREKAPTWQEGANKKRLEALAAAVAAEPAPIQQTPPVEKADAADRGRDGGSSMAIDRAPPTSSSSKQAKQKGGLAAKGAVQKRKKARKVGVLAGINQFHKKGKKGSKGRK